jgi:hypothetical protein
MLTFVEYMQQALPVRDPTLQKERINTREHSRLSTNMEVGSATWLA